MIEIVTDSDRNLKNIKQIGTPREDNKIYIENYVYSKIKEVGYTDKKVFVLMGHTERTEGRYATFIEAVVPVKEIEFLGNAPRWNNATWKEVYSEIKRLYEDMIIVGWAIDLKGMRPKLVPEIERAHREHFGGVHQLLFLLDTLEGEETFYIYKENKLISKLLLSFASRTDIISSYSLPLVNSSTLISVSSGIDESVESTVIPVLTSDDLREITISSKSYFSKSEI